jgi:FAD-dependent oxidoreductase domain-containing protein 1
MTPRTATDVAITGAGVMGCATAVHLLRDEPGLGVTLIEPDPAYTLAATPRASGGVRQLFSCPENIAMTQYTLDVIAGWCGFAGADAPDLLWRPNGYLFVGADAASLQASLEVQLAHGVRAEWLEPRQLAARFPLVAVGDLAGGVLSPDDGWLDPTALHKGMLTMARRLGAQHLRDQVVGFDITRTRVTAVRLKSGERLAANAVVNAAGCWAAELAARAGMPVPVEPMRRYEHYAETREDLDDLPFVKDPAGLAVRPQGPGISAGLVNFSHPGGFDLSVDHGYFERIVWPAVAHRLPRLDHLRLRSTTAGLYDQNRLDGNMIIGSHPGHLDNFYLACGFSGHGLMHAPAVGRALTELILHREYRTIDLTRMGYQRILDNAPYAETGIR